MWDLSESDVLFVISCYNKCQQQWFSDIFLLLLLFFFFFFFSVADYIFWGVPALQFCTPNWSVHLFNRSLDTHVHTWPTVLDPARWTHRTKWEHVFIVVDLLLSYFYFQFCTWEGHSVPKRRYQPIELCLVTTDNTEIWIFKTAYNRKY
jgi:hypothetical protein